MQNIDISKDAGIDIISGKCLKVGAEIVAKPLSEICNLPLPPQLFQMPLKLQSPNLFLRKAKKPIEPIEPIKPIEPIEPIKPIEPIEPIKPIEPIEPIELQTYVFVKVDFKHFRNSYL